MSLLDESINNYSKDVLEEDIMVSFPEVEEIIEEMSEYLDLEEDVESEKEASDDLEDLEEETEIDSLLEELEQDLDTPLKEDVEEEISNE